MNEFPENLWAPWRMEYIRSIGDESKSGCFLCDYRDAPQEDAGNHVICRTDHAFLMMNRFPYTNGHLLVAPLGHKADLEDLSDAQMNGLWYLTRDAKVLLTDTLHPHGFNVGINFGLCAGAGLPGHLHLHVVPRWNGDTNFMAVLGDVRIIPESLDRLHKDLVGAVAKLGLPRPPQGSAT